MLYDSYYNLISGPSRSGYTFLGWGTTPAHSTNSDHYPAGKEMLCNTTENIHYYAHWQLDHPCTDGDNLGPSCDAMPVAKVPATCTSGSFTGTVCKYCGKVMTNNGSTGDALGHLQGHDQKGACDNHDNDDRTYYTDTGHTDYRIPCSNSSTGYHVPTWYGYSADHSNHAKCRDGYDEFSYFRHIYCGRHTTIPGAASIKYSNGNYYCGYVSSYYWCTMDRGHDGKIIFGCNNDGVNATVIKKVPQS